MSQFTKKSVLKCCVVVHHRTSSNPRYWQSQIRHSSQLIFLLSSFELVCQILWVTRDCGLSFHCHDHILYWHGVMVSWLTWCHYQQFGHLCPYIYILESFLRSYIATSHVVSLRMSHHLLMSPAIVEMDGHSDVTVCTIRGVSWVVRVGRHGHGDVVRRI